jgi:hypothetical protein
MAHIARCKEDKEKNEKILLARIEMSKAYGWVEKCYEGEPSIGSLPSVDFITMNPPKSYQRSLCGFPISADTLCPSNGKTYWIPDYFWIDSIIKSGKMSYSRHQ